MLRTHTCGELTKKSVGETVTLAAWVQSRRDHGGVIFLDLRDQYGITQVTVDPEAKEAFEAADKVRSEYVVRVTGEVAARPDDMVNSNLPTGEVEVLAKDFQVISTAKTPPFEISEFSDNVNEEVRLKYRYLDLRQRRMHENIALRHNMIKMIRDFMDEQGFLEIETPNLVKGTPEGSREFIVPSRLHAGEFYVLPQAPQQLKQLLMVSGFDKYFQIARCFRDEDQRADRQPEFTQLDIEMAFVEQNDIFAIVENLLLLLSTNLAPHLTLKDTEFPRIPFKDAMNRFGSDKPDLRIEMEIVDLTEDMKSSGFQVFQKVIADGGVVKALRVPGGLELSRKEIDDLTKMVQDKGLGGLAYVQVDKDENRSPILKFLSEDEQKAIVEKTGAKPGDIIFFAADEWQLACESLGDVRLECAKRFDLVNKDQLAYAFIVDFPLFEKDAEGNLTAVHNPFTSPQAEDIPLLESDPFSVRANQYDVVLNGWEIFGGAIRIHDGKLQKKIFEILGVSEEAIERRFGHILKAFQYGVPPHGGIASGLDRLVAIFAGEENIREVIAFPKNQTAQDLMLGAPSPLPEEALAEANIELKKQSK